MACQKLTLVEFFLIRLKYSEDLDIHKFLFSVCVCVSKLGSQQCLCPDERLAQPFPSQPQVFTWLSALIGKDFHCVQKWSSHSTFYAFASAPLGKHIFLRHCLVSLIAGLHPFTKFFSTTCWKLTLQ